MYDVINNPSHYCEGRKHQPIDVISDWELNFNIGCVVKYMSRAGRKHQGVNGTLEDLKKARFYLNHEIESLEQVKIATANIFPVEGKMVAEAVKEIAGE